MGLLIGETAPDFEAETTQGRIKFHDWIGDSWAVLFSHPKDFTPVCTTELGTVAKIKQEFEQRHCKVVGLSVDPLTSHQGWIKDIERTQDCRMNFPVIADADRSVAKLYDMIHPEANDTFTVRSVFLDVYPFGTCLKSVLPSGCMSSNRTKALKARLRTTSFSVS